MASGVTDFGATAWLAALFGVDPDITGYYVALCTDEPGTDSDGTALADIEPVDVAYSREAYGTGGANWGTNGPYITTLLDIDFGIPTVDWGQISHFALCTAATAGDVYAFGEFLSPQQVTADFDFVIPAGGVVISLTALQNSIAI